MERIPMTPDGFQKLHDELQRIKSVDRPQVVKDIEEARAHGDLSANAEYHAAKEKQGLLAARLNFLEDRLSRAEVIDPKKNTNITKIIFGATVKVYDITNDQEAQYKIVGDDEADLKTNTIGISSPMARGLIGKSQGDEAMVHTPKGKKEFEILEVSYL